MKQIDALIGERMTFVDLIKRYHIQIPIIQRDYAQGRASEYQVRERFLYALYTYLDENKKHRDLDFIYGNQKLDISDGELTFIPLDGQQRLTTLFLLHWYLATKDKMLEEYRKLVLFETAGGQKRSKFTYETRVSSREFCDALMIADIDFDNLLESDTDEENSLSKSIRDQSWYFLSWEFDPTIQAMLTMLDAMHRVFSATEKFYQRLVQPDNPVITFQFLDLGIFDQPDDLYIKMNARGIPLTTFENFKARLEQYLKRAPFNKKANNRYALPINGTLREVDLKTYLSHRIDGKWANVFWRYASKEEEEYDRLLMNFFQAFIANHYAIQPGQRPFLYTLIHSTDIPFDEYIAHKCLTEETIVALISFLDLIGDENAEQRQYLENHFYYDEKELFNVIARRSSKQADYVERIQFYAYSQYLVHHSSDGNILDTVSLTEWMRVIYNLVTNTAPYDTIQQFIASLRAVDNLLEHSDTILDYLVESDDSLSGFDEFQFKEERLKAHLILQQNDWRTLIEELEQHGYFEGQIGILFFLSGIEDYFGTHGNCMWNAEKNTAYKQAALHYRNLLIEIFDNKGLREFPEFLWERALLAVGDYLISEGRNQSFLINRDRDISWKRLMKRDKDLEQHPTILRTLFSNIAPPAEKTVKESLEEIIKSYNGNDWRKRFIEIPNLFTILGGKRFVRKESAHGFTLLLGERMSGYHEELYTKTLFLTILHNRNVPPFSNSCYHQEKGDSIEYMPCIRFFGWEYEGIKYEMNIQINVEQTDIHNSEDPEFLVRFFGRNNESYPQAIVEALTSCKFTEVNRGYQRYARESTISSFLEELSSELQRL